MKPAPIVAPTVTDTLDKWGNFIVRNVEGDPYDYDKNGDIINRDED